MIPLSILDLSVVTTGTKPAAALRNSIDLARHGGFGARGDDGKVKDRERYHGANLVPRRGRTKGRPVQIRRAPADRGSGNRPEFRWEKPCADITPSNLPIFIL